MSHYVFTVIVSLTVLSIVSRVLPFLIGDLLSSSDRIRYLGRQLPAYIMMLLVVYEVEPKNLAHMTSAAPALIALLLVVVVHVRFRQTLLSLLVGTASYMLLRALM